MRVFLLLVKLEQEVWNIINYWQEYIILGAASTMTNESVPSTGKGSTRGMEYCN